MFDSFTSHETSNVTAKSHYHIQSAQNAPIAHFPNHVMGHVCVFIVSRNITGQLSNPLACSSLNKYPILAREKMAKVGQMKTKIHCR